MIRLLETVWSPPVVVFTIPLHRILLGLVGMVMESTSLWVMVLVGYLNFVPWICAERGLVVVCPFCDCFQPRDWCLVLRGLFGSICYFIISVSCTFAFSFAAPMGENGAAGTGSVMASTRSKDVLVVVSLGDSTAIFV